MTEECPIELLEPEGAYKVGWGGGGGGGGYHPRDLARAEEEIEWDRLAKLLERLQRNTSVE